MFEIITCATNTDFLFDIVLCKIENIYMDKIKSYVIQENIYCKILYI